MTLLLARSISVLALICGISSANAAPAQFGVGPDNNQELLFNAFNTAKHALDINMYEFKSDRIAQAVIARIESGVAVRLLIEGQPVGGVSQTEKDNLDAIRAAMVASRNPGHRLFVMTAQDKTKRRFVFDHAKYMVMDGASAWVSSDNFSASGHTDAGKIGNRGWDVILADSGLAKKLSQYFASDADPSQGDVVLVKANDPIPLELAPNGNSVSKVAAARTASDLPLGEGDVASADVIVSPHSAAGIVKLLDSARDHVEVQHMSLPSTWKDAAGQVLPSPLVDAIVKAAERGVQVRVLLNDESAFGTVDPTGGETDSSVANKTKPNQVAVDYLNGLAQSRKLPLQAKIVDVKAVGITYIHNKGMLVDGHRTLVSSINGTRNSVENNRELAVVLEGQDAGRYYAQAFDFDWRSSPATPPLATGPELDLFTMPGL